MIRTVNFLAALGWLVMFVAFMLTDFEPHSLTVGLAMFLSAYYFLDCGLEAK